MADDWSAPPTPQDYDGPAQDGVRRMLGVIERQRRELDEMRNNLLKTAGLSVSEEGLLVDSALRVTGATLIEGPLTLQPGSIENESLTSPVTPAGTSGVAEMFGLTTTSTVVVSATVTVPEGFTSCLATGLGTIFALNPTPDVDYLYARVYITAPGGREWWGIRPLSMMGPNNGSAALSPNRTAMIDGLTGGQVLTFEVRAFTAFAAMQSDSNLAGISGQAIFFR